MSVVDSQAPEKSSVLSTGDGLWRLSVEKYHEMILHGILTPDDRVELIEGLLVEKMPKNPPHSATLRLLRKAIEKLLPPGWQLFSQDPITLRDGEPEPDAAIVRGEDEDFEDRHPGPTEARLVIEVSDCSLRMDRGLKKRSYARAKIAEYWIVNHVDGVVEIYSQPGRRGNHPDYLTRKDFGLKETISLDLGGSQLSMRVDEFLRTTPGKSGG